MSRMTSYDPSADLLTPVLTEADDAVGFDRPWTPWHLVFLTFFFGITAGGGLLALNFGRLGQPQRVAGALVFVAVASIATMFGFALLVPEIGRPETKIVRRAIFLAAAIGMAALQRRRHRLHEACDLPAGKLLGPALAAIAIGSGIDAGIAVLVATLLGIGAS